MFYESCSMDIIGHQKIIKYLDKSIEKDALAQAYLFSGPEHLGKFSVALEFARKITGGENQKINPDIIIIAPEIEEKKGIKKEKDIKVEKIREIEKELGLSAYFGKYKVVIIDSANRLTISAQNALLKTLEEPQKKCIIMLISHNQEKILPTIKSRCLIKKFSLVNELEIKAIISDKKNQDKILFWSLNCPGLAMILQEEKGELEKRIESRKDLELILENNLSERFKFCENLSKDTDELVRELNFWSVMLRRNMLEKKFLSLNSEKSLIIIEEIEKSLDLIRETNSNARIVLENLVLKF